MTVAQVEPRDALPVSHDTDSWAVVAPDVYELAKRIADTDFVPEHFRGNPAAITAAVLYGREAGLPPMTTLTQTYVVHGRPGMQAEAMRALVLSQGHEIRVDESTGARCKLSGRRRGTETWTSTTWTLDDARKAELLPAKKGSGWLTYPRQMLVARATAELCRLIFPDVIHGFRALEELTDEAQGTDPDALAPEAPKPKRTRVSRAKKQAPAPPAEDVPLPGPTASETLPPDARSRPVDEVPLPDDVDDYRPVVVTGAPDVPEVVEALRGAPSEPVPDEVGQAAEVVADIVDAEVVEDSEDDGQPDATRKPLISRLRSMVMARWSELGVVDRRERLYYTGLLIERPEIKSNNDLSERELSSVATALAMARTRTDVEGIVKAQADYVARKAERREAEAAEPLRRDQLPLPDMPPDQ